MDTVIGTVILCACGVVIGIVTVVNRRHMWAHVLMHAFIVSIMGRAVAASLWRHEYVAAVVMAAGWAASHAIAAGRLRQRGERPYGADDAGGDRGGGNECGRSEDRDRA